MPELNLDFPEKMRPLFEERKRFNVIEGGRGSTKSWTVADLFLILGLEGSKRFLMLREIQNSIKDSVHKLLKDKIDEKGYPYHVTDRAIRSKVNKTEFLFAGMQDHTVNSIKSFEGVDGVWGEEAQMFSKNSLDILIPTIRKPDSFFVFTMNRFEELDPIWDRLCNPLRDNVLHININYWDAIGYCPQVLVEEAELCKEENYNDYLHIWGGEPISQGENSIIGLAKIKQAMERTVKGEGPIELGIDVARFGSDKTTIYKRRGMKLLDFVVLNHKRSFEIVDQAYLMLENYPDDEVIHIKVDDTGVGGGVTDEFVRRSGDDRYKKKYNPTPVNNGSNAKNPNKYVNAINEMWFEFNDIIELVELPNDPELKQQLAGRRYKFDSSGRRVIESKDDFKKRYGVSPDKADGLLLCFYVFYRDSGIC